MQEVSTKNFGLLIAYLLPGFTALFGASYFSQTVEGWLIGPPMDGPTVGGFLYVTLGAVAAGLTVSTVRWMIIDTIHHWTGIRDPGWDFSQLQERISAFDVLVEIHYRYYQFYSNMLIALGFTYISKQIHEGLTAFGWIDVGVFAIGVVFFFGSRDTLKKYYTRVATLLGTNHFPPKEPPPEEEAGNQTEASVQARIFQKR